jgi:hypothetical protein
MSRKVCEIHAEALQRQGLSVADKGSNRRLEFQLCAWFVNPRGFALVLSTGQMMNNKNVLLAVPTVHDMVDRARILHSHGARHYDRFSGLPTPVNRITAETDLRFDRFLWVRRSPCSGQDFYDQAFVARVSPDGHVGYNWMANRHLPSPEFHWLDCRPYGLQTDLHGFGGLSNSCLRAIASRGRGRRLQAAASR